MKITKRQLRRIIKEEKVRLQEVEYHGTPLGDALKDIESALGAVRDDGEKRMMLYDIQDWLYELMSKEGIA